MFSVGIKPRIKDNALTMMNGARYPGEASADDFACVDIGRFFS
jgi:hypothetical protein